MPESILVQRLSRAVALWVLACVTLAARWLPAIGEQSPPIRKAGDFFRAGPGPGLVMFGAAVDTWVFSSRFARIAKGFMAC